MSDNKGILVEGPQLLRLPPKMIPMITHFNDYRYFLAEGGRGSGKTQGDGRFILTLADQRKIRVVCGRETQSTIEESVYKVLVDLIREYDLNFTITKNRIINKRTQSEILFKGFREQGSVNIKGLEGVDILWIDEAEAITKQTLDTIIPTIRKPKSRIFFTMNRRLLNDPVYEFCQGNDKCLHIKINYTDNPYCSQELIEEAERCRLISEKDYRHIWLGEPMEQADDYLLNPARVIAMKDVQASDDGAARQRVVAIDFAAKGNDFCVATTLDRVSHACWNVMRQDVWQEADSMASIGRIVNILTQMRPTLAILDVGGMGCVVHDRLLELGINILPFNGAETGGVPEEYGNKRAWGYYLLRDYIEKGWIRMNSPETEKELLSIRFKYKQSNGKRMIQSKDEMRSQGIKSPDRADSLMMGVYCIHNHLGQLETFSNSSGTIKRINQSKWR